MKKAKFGLVVQVKNLDDARVFYRDLLGLGAPTLDGSFAVEFNLGDDFKLTLEKSVADFLQPQFSPQTLVIYNLDIEQLRERCRDSVLELRPAKRPEGDFWQLSDPEGNTILIG